MAMSKVVLAFGLISFPASLDKATETGVEMKNLCIGSNGEPAHDPTPLTAPRTCACCGEITDYSGIVKGIKQGTTYAIAKAEDVADAVIKNTAAYKGRINLVPHPLADFEAHTAPGDKLYYIVPSPEAADHYQLMVRLIQSHPELAFVSLYTPRSATGLYCVKARDGVLVLEERTRGQAVKAAPTVGGSVNEQLFGMLDMTLSTFVQPYDPDAYEDTYAAAIAALAANASDMVALGKEATANKPTALPSDTDLMAKLTLLAKGAAA